MRSLAVLVAVATLCGCGNPSGFNDPDKLAASIRTKAQTRITHDPDTFGKGTTVTRVTCVEGKGRTFKCAGELSTGQHYSIKATVSKDGRHYVTD